MEARVMLIVRDGWGYSAVSEGNAIMHADTPFDDYLVEKTNQALLVCHGRQVGLPDGFQGSSEVGHLNMGAGRIVEQEVTRIFSSMETGELFGQPVFGKIRQHLKTSGSSLHIFGLLQDEGVHAHQQHLFQLLQYFKQNLPDLNIWIHCIADGRDTPPRSFRQFYTALLNQIQSYGRVFPATVWGRYYGMDRSRKWNLIEVAYRAMVFGEGRRVDDILEAVQSAYASELTPDRVPMFDEYLNPLIQRGYPGMHPGDVVINFNYRQDRAIEISQAFVDPACPAYNPFSGRVEYYGLTQYYDAFDRYFMKPISDSASMKDLLGEVISRAGCRQLRIAETQKFRHVTSFFNGKHTAPNPKEDQVEIPSQYDPSSFASHPEMNAADVTEELIRRMSADYRFVLVNYANCDMVGHTGDYRAAMEGARIVDENVQKAARAALEKGFEIIVTADHGNSEEMLDAAGEPKTSHTTNPVKVHFLSRRRNIIPGAPKGILSDISAVVLRLMGLEVPPAMVSRGLVDGLTVQE